MSHSRAICGVVAPAGIPSTVRAELVAALAYARQTPAMKQQIESLNYEPIYDDRRSSPLPYGPRSKNIQPLPSGHGRQNRAMRAGDCDCTC